MVEVVVSQSGIQDAARLEGTPAHGDGACVGIEAAEGIARAREDFGAREEVGVYGDIGKVVACLWVEKGETAEGEAAVFEGAATDGDIGLAFGKAACLQVHAGLEAEAGDGRGETGRGRFEGNGGGLH